MVEQKGVWHYLAIFISGWRLRRVDCSRLERVILECLQGWQARVLSMMGKVILLMSILNFMLVYLLVNTLMLKMHLLKLEQHFRHFL